MRLYTKIFDYYNSIGCTAERFFRIDRAQEHLHYVTDIAQNTIYLLDPDATNSQFVGSVTPAASSAGGGGAASMPGGGGAGSADSNGDTLYRAASSGSSDNLESRAGTPSSPSGRQKNFFQRSVSGGGGAGNSVSSLSPLPGDVVTVRKCSDSSQGSQGSCEASASDYLRNGARMMEPAVNFKR